MIRKLLSLFRKKPASDPRWRYLGVHIAVATQKARSLY